MAVLRFEALRVSTKPEGPGYPIGPILHANSESAKPVLTGQKEWLTMSDE